MPQHSGSEDALTRLLKEIDQIEIQKLCCGHGLSEFCCGTGKDDKELDSFLKEDALKQQNERANATYVTVLKGTDKVIGYVTILNDKLIVSTKEKGGMNITAPYHEFPAVKVGRLAVDKSHTGRHIATTMLHYVRGLVLESSEKIGCRFLIVDAYPKSVDFYIKKGFARNLIQEQNSRIIKINEKQNGTTRTAANPARETVSLRYDLLNPAKQDFQK